HELGGNARIGAAQDDGKRLLPPPPSSGEREGVGLPQGGIGGARACDKPTVAFSQPRECFGTREHGVVGRRQALAACTSGRRWRNNTTPKPIIQSGSRELWTAATGATTPVMLRSMPTNPPAATARPKTATQAGVVRERNKVQLERRKNMLKLNSPRNSPM